MRTPAHVIDLLATCLDLAGAKYPQQHNGKAITPTAGQSLKPLLIAPDQSPPDALATRALFWEHEGHAAVREGKFKLVRKGRTGPWQLYDMKGDRTEMNDLAAAQPERVRELAAAWQAWAEKNQVLPAPAGGEGKGKAKGGR